MDKAALIDKIKNHKLCPEGRPSYRDALVALKEIGALKGITELDKKVVLRAKQELVEIVSEYRRIQRVKKKLRRKHTRG